MANFDHPPNEPARLALYMPRTYTHTKIIPRSFIHYGKLPSINIILVRVFKNCVYYSYDPASAINTNLLNF